jgi:hypothetical protein
LIENITGWVAYCTDCDARKQWRRANILKFLIQANFQVWTLKPVFLKSHLRHQATAGINKHLVSTTTMTPVKSSDRKAILLTRHPLHLAENVGAERKMVLYRVSGL